MSEDNETEQLSWRSRLKRAAAELGRMAALRRELAALELAHDRRLLRRSAVAGGIGFVLLIVGLTLLFQAAARGLALVTVLGISAWGLIIGSLLFLPGILLVAAAIRKARADFRGLRSTLAELNEDLIWLREWAQPHERDRETDMESNGGQHEN